MYPISSQINNCFVGRLLALRIFGRMTFTEWRRQAGWRAGMLCMEQPRGISISWITSFNVVSNVFKNGASCPTSQWLMSGGHSLDRFPMLFLHPGRRRVGPGFPQSSWAFVSLRCLVPRVWSYTLRLFPRFSAHWSVSPRRHPLPLLLISSTSYPLSSFASYFLSRCALGPSCHFNTASFQSQMDPHARLPPISPGTSDGPSCRFPLISNLVNVAFEPLEPPAAPRINSSRLPPISQQHHVNQHAHSLLSGPVV